MAGDRDMAGDKDVAASSIHRYPIASLVFDGVRAAFGLIVTLGPLAILDVAWPLEWILFALALIFLGFTCQLMAQALTSLELSTDGISRGGPLEQTLTWSDLTFLKLSHYAAPRRASEGWYRLTIRDTRGVLKVNSTIDGFDDILAAAVRAADRGGLALDPATDDNIKHFDIGISRTFPMR